jgi:CheY-like chemotaxis protein
MPVGTDAVSTEEKDDGAFSFIDLSGHVVLVVEDDGATRELLSTILAGCGARVTTVGSVAAAMETLDAEVPGLILADIGMPGEDGLSMIRRIRKRPAGRGGLVCAVALSAYARRKDREAALAAGYDDFLTKPAMPRDVLRAVSRWLSAPPHHPADHRLTAG